MSIEVKANRWTTVGRISGWRRERFCVTVATDRECRVWVWAPLPLWGRFTGSWCRLTRVGIVRVKSPVDTTGWVSR